MKVKNVQRCPSVTLNRRPQKQPYPNESSVQLSLRALCGGWSHTVRKLGIRHASLTRTVDFKDPNHTQPDLQISPLKKNKYC